MEEEEKPDNDRWEIIIFFTIIAFFVALINFLKNQEWQKRTYKKTMAKRYGLAAPETLIKWINLYCPKDIVDKYVGNKKHFIRDIDITTHLGKPESYPKDEKENDISSKSEIAQFLHLTSRTFSRRIQAIEEPENVIGMSLEQYKNQKRFPPKYVHLIIDHLS